MADVAPLIFTNPIMVESVYMLSGIFFILSLGGLSHPESSKRGNLYGIYGMALAIIATFFTEAIDGLALAKFAVALVLGALIGIRLALIVQMISMPQLVAALHSFVGIAATIVGYGSFFQNNAYGIDLGLAHHVELFIGVFIGAITFIGSVVAFLKLHELINSKPLIILGSFRHFINLILVLACVGLCVAFCIDPFNIVYLAVMTGLSLILGWHLIMAIGGADMPVVVSMLNSYSGWATAASGFMLNNNLLVIAGALVGSSGAILSYIMCRGMNRSFFSVIAGGFGLEPTVGAVIAEGAEMQEAKLPEVVQAIKSAKSVVIVPGYGMAMSKCQYEVGSLAKVLRGMGIEARFCIHPVAGRLPGHMNVLLAEANVPYNYVYEMEHINHDFPKTDVVLVVGANDTVNPDAIENPQSVLAGMPVCEVWKAKQVFVVKRSKATGYAAIDNSLFYKPNCKMFFGDAKKQITAVLNEVTQGAGVQIERREEVKIDVAETKEVEEDMRPYLEKCKKEVGVPKEVHEGEKRVAITPTIARRFIKLGFRVKVETGAGEGAGFSDGDYENAGCDIVGTNDLWDNTEIIVKVRAPEQNKGLKRHEADSLKNTQLLISYLYPAQNNELLHQLAENKPHLSAFALDCTPRISRAQKLDTLSSTANLAGYRAILEAFNEFPRFSKQVSSAAGKVPPAKVLIMGAGVAGLSAIGLAKGMGAIVRAFDTRAAAKDQVESLGGEFLEVDYQESGEGGGGYAKEMSEGYKQAQRKLIQKQAKEVDVIFTTALIPGKKAPILIDAETVRLMKPNSVIVDLAAEMGGNCELTQPGKRHVDPESRVIILGYTDLPSRMAQQSSELFAVNMYNLFEDLCTVPKNPGHTAEHFAIDLNDEVIKGLCVIHDGQIIWGQAPPAQPQATPAVLNNVAQANKPAEVKPAEKSAAPKNDHHVSPEDMAKPELSETSAFRSSALAAAGLIIFFVILGLIPVDHSVLLNRIFIFVLAIFIGYMVIWNVTAQLHTPLMSVTNAISGIIIVGSMLELKSDPLVTAGSACGLVGVFFASINIFGGFIVTQRMLNMFKSQKA